MRSAWRAGSLRRGARAVAAREGAAHRPAARHRAGADGSAVAAALHVAEIAVPVGARSEARAVLVGAAPVGGADVGATRNPVGADKRRTSPRTPALSPRRAPAEGDPGDEGAAHPVAEVVTNRARERRAAVGRRRALGARLTPLAARAVAGPVGEAHRSGTATHRAARARLCAACSSDARLARGARPGGVRGTARHRRDDAHAPHAGLPGRTGPRRVRCAARRGQPGYAREHGAQLPRGAGDAAEAAVTRVEREVDALPRAVAESRAAPDARRRIGGARHEHRAPEHHQKHRETPHVILPCARGKPAECAGIFSVDIHCYARFDGATRRL